MKKDSKKFYKITYMSLTLLLTTTFGLEYELYNKNIESEVEELTLLNRDTPVFIDAAKIMEDSEELVESVDENNGTASYSIAIPNVRANVKVIVNYKQDSNVGLDTINITTPYDKDNDYPNKKYDRYTYRYELNENDDKIFDVSVSYPRADEIRGIEIDTLGHTVRIDGEEIEMTAKEYDLLLMFVRNKGIVLSRDKILSKVWGYDYFGDDRTVDWQIKLLRGKLGKRRDCIKTIRGVGYKFEEA